MAHKPPGKDRGSGKLARAKEERAAPTRMIDTQKLPWLPSSRPPSMGPPSSAPGLDEEGDTRDTEKALSIPSPRTDRDRASLTLLTGPNAGQVFSLENETVLGRDFDAHVRVDDPSISRAHARIVRLQPGKYRLEDLESTNGTFIGEDRVEKRDLVSGDRIQLGPKLTLRFAITDEAEQMLQRQLFESSTRDHLTRVFNRRYLMARLSAEVAHARRHGTALGLILFDIDQFKRLNDEHGHLAGDAVLRSIADRVSSLIRVEDVFARFGGEEFVVLIRAFGSLDAPRLGERLRTSIASMIIRAEGVEITVSISAGVASLGELEAEAGGQELIGLADARLLRAKAEGRNRVRSDDR